MGREIIFRCGKCGASSAMTTGYSMMAPSIENVLNGYFGEDVKKLLEEHPGDEIDICHAAYQCHECKCIDSDLMITIRKDGKKIWKESACRCPKCKKAMRRIYDVPDSVLCPDCGTEMSSEDLIMFD